MKGALLALLCLTVVLSSVNGFGRGRGIGGFGRGGFGRGIGGFGRGGFGRGIGGFGRLGGLGFGGLGGLGFGGLGFGGFGLGGLGFGGLGLGGLGFGGLIGKRDVAQIEKEFKLAKNKIINCSYDSKTNMIKFGEENCEVEPEFISWKPINHSRTFMNLTALPELFSAKTNDLIFNLFSFDKKTKEINDFTFMKKSSGHSDENEEKITFALYFKAIEDQEGNKLDGFRFKSGACWNKFVENVRQSMPGNIRFSKLTIKSDIKKVKKSLKQIKKNKSEKKH